MDTHSPTEERRLFTVPQAANTLGISRSRVYELLRSGALESVSIGRSRRIPVDALERFVQGLRVDRLSSEVVR